MADNINYLLDVGKGDHKPSFHAPQVSNYLKKENQDDETLYKFRANTDHHGPSKMNDPKYNGSLYNIMVEWETEEITQEPCLSLLKMIQSFVQHMPRNIIYYTYLNGIN